MKKILLCGLNASFSHSSLSLMCLRYSSRLEIDTVEFTINDSVSDIVRGIVFHNPDAVGFSCYIWNIEHVLKAASSVKKILPDCFIFLGGPEVSFDSDSLMEKYDFLDLIIKGCGEIPFSYFCESFNSGSGIELTPSACIRAAGGIITTADAPTYDMNDTPFMYGDIGRFKNKILYYETSRGCPFRCSYCMSADTGVSFLNLGRVKTELEYFMRSDVIQVKFVDRTFNYPPQRAYEIIETIIELSEKYPLSNTKFHLEITASLLDEKTIELLKRARRGLIQIEAGIQSTNQESLRAINRGADTDKTLTNISALCGMGNIHVHADLIAGLPLESYDSFKKSFNDAYSINSDNLQLGFLKVLKGSPLRDLAGKYGLVFTDHAPYEILRTGSMTFNEITKLHLVEKVLNLLYNSGLLRNSLRYILPCFGTPFDFFESFALYLDSEGYFKSPKKSAALFETLYDFSAGKGPGKEIIKEALCLDWLRLGKPGSWPAFLEPGYTEPEKIKIRVFFENTDNIDKYLPGYSGLSPKEISKRCEVFIAKKIFPGKTAFLFDYGKKAGDADFRQTILLI